MNEDYGLFWFDVGNFKKPWKVVDCTLDKDVDIQELGKLSLAPIPALIVHNNVVRWDNAASDKIIGYSLYKSAKRLNDRIVTERAFTPQENLSLKHVLCGGFETVYSSQGLQGAPDENRPIAYAFDIFPNPFVEKTNIHYALPHPAFIEIVVYDACGRKVKTLVSEKLEPSYYQTDWSGKDEMGRKVANGIYFIWPIAKEYRFQEKVIMCK